MASTVTNFLAMLGSVSPSCHIHAGLTEAGGVPFRLPVSGKADRPLCSRAATAPSGAADKWLYGLSLCRRSRRARGRWARH